MVKSAIVVLAWGFRQSLVFAQDKQFLNNMSTTEPTKYRSTSTANILERRENMFYWRGRYFHGLVDVKENSLYDDPMDSFNEHLGLQTALKRELIEVVEEKVDE